MMTITPSYDGNAAVEYYKTGLRQEGGYYTKDEVPSFFAGNTAVSLELHGLKVTPELFSKLVNNRHPKNQDQKLTVLDAANRRAGYDFTFSAVKSLSIVHAITKDPELLAAHRHAYRSAMRAIEKHAQTQANTQYERGWENTGNIIYAPFDHFTTRPIQLKRNGKTIYVPDPQMHTHCYVPNITFVKGKNRYQALETGNIHKLAPYFEAYYHSVLAHRLNKIGYQVERKNGRYEIKGVSRSIIERYSGRTQQIEKVAKEKGITDDKQKAQLGAKTRHSKNKSVPKGQFYGLWKERLPKEQFEALQNIKGKYTAQKSITAKEAIDRSLEHFLERNSVAEEKRVLAHAMSLSYGSLLPDQVSKELNSRKNILRSERNTISIITTQEMVQAENKMIKLATAGKGKFRPINPNHKIKRDFFNKDQTNAIQVTLTSTDFVTILQGKAGSGKTTLSSEISDGVKAVNKPMLTIAPSSQAVEVLRQEGFDSHTVAAFLINPSLQQKIKNGVLYYDEAGLSGVKTKTEVLLKAKEQNAQVILSGDIKQHSSPGEYGDALRILQDKAKLKTARVQKIMRQKPKDYRQAVEKAAKGRTLEAYQALNKMEAVHEIPEQDERIDRIAEDYTSSVKAKRSALIVSPTHVEGEMITDVVRQKLKADKRIKGKERSFETLANLSFTESQKKDLMNYNEGQVLRFTKNQKGFKAGSHWEILPHENKDTVQVRNLKSGEVLKLPHETPEHFQVYQKTRTDIAIGDLIRPTANLKSKENTKINNGTPQRVKGFVGGDIKLENGKILAKDSFHFKHGYVETSHSSQGKTAQDVYISMSEASLPAVNDQAFYVSISRGTHSVRLYTSDKAALKNSIVRSGERITANEIAEEHERRLLEQKQRTHHQNLNRTIEEHGRSKQREKSAERYISDGLQHRR